MSEKKAKSKSVKKRIAVIVIAAALVLSAAAAFVIYTGVYYHADDTAAKALQNDGSSSVTAERTDYGWFFDGPGTDSALIFYPGGKVEETAYAPLLRKIASDGIDVCLLKVPFRLAIFSVNAAERPLAEYDYEHWYVGGHSLGGVTAAMFAAENADAVDGVVLLAAYSTKPLDNIEVISVRGTEDKVLDLEKYEENRVNLPEDAAEIVIEGGNHSQFGSYGPQKGDGTAGIAPEKQIEDTAEAIVKRFGKGA